MVSTDGRTCGPTRRRLGVASTRPRGAPSTHATPRRLRPLGRRSTRSGVASTRTPTATWRICCRGVQAPFRRPSRRLGMRRTSKVPPSTSPAATRAASRFVSSRAGPPIAGVESTGPRRTTSRTKGNMLAGWRTRRSESSARCVPDAPPRTRAARTPSAWASGPRPATRRIGRRPQRRSRRKGRPGGLDLRRRWRGPACLTTARATSPTGRPSGR
mmetsp:Transcript_42061/g.83628  ORF Transcript_42061/g.83628 Transcript_42061/m.83628 type:complete len:215 (+) Transcript_42061:246-890(+)